MTLLTSDDGITAAQTVAELRSLLLRQYEAAVDKTKGLTGRNVDKFLHVLGAKFYRYAHDAVTICHRACGIALTSRRFLCGVCCRLMHTHIKKFTITPDGALNLLKYVSWIP